ncbi:TPA: hypothetical protein ACVO0J_004854 [Vibrio diabolicus]|uniref:hypothetical protein n=1 Tax=Vibrio diabolicus TaxID=50719 RepID=UPI0011A1E0D6|nr:hypothetical protein [Vibrio diabolicus]MCS0397194.1 hypothetical protein [Vibrio diabolicus]MCS0413540.1 hypothetical protein [Vibrio diabolicus]
MKKILAFTLLVLLAPTVYAVGWKWSGYVYIQKVYPSSDGLNFFPNYKDDSVSACDGGSRFILPLSTPNYEVKASALIAAFMANKKVTIAYNVKQTKSCSAIVDRFMVSG